MRRLIATLRYIDGLTLGEVAQEVGMSLSGVRKRLRSLRLDRPTRPLARRQLVPPVSSATLTS